MSNPVPSPFFSPKYFFIFIFVFDMLANLEKNFHKYIVDMISLGVSRTNSINLVTFLKCYYDQN